MPPSEVGPLWRRRRGRAGAVPRPRVCPQGAGTGPVWRLTGLGPGPRAPVELRAARLAAVGTSRPRQGRT
eukprot:6686915-Pyramimonas_sp.AAC.1